MRQTRWVRRAGACNHALGYCKQAVEDYQACFMTSEEGLDAEARGLIYLGFYQKELAQHLAANLDRPAALLCVDRDIDPVFKVLAVLTPCSGAQPLQRLTCWPRMPTCTAAVLQAAPAWPVPWQDADAWPAP